MRLFPTFALSPLLLAFSGGCLAVEGLWLFTLTPREPIPATSECTTNFNGAQCREVGVDTGYYGGDGEMEVTRRVAYPEYHAIGQIVDVTGQRGVLMFAGRAFDGEKVDGSWVFTYENSQSVDTTEIHPAGFFFLSTEGGTETHTLGLGAAEKGVRTGLLTSRSSFEASWEETDEWDPGDVGRSWTSIPSWQYLTYGNGPTSTTSSGYGGSSRYNYPNQDNCSGERCTLDVTSEQRVEYDVSAIRVKGDPEDLVVSGPEEIDLPSPGF